MAEGEVTGHHHAIAVAPGVRFIEDESAVRYLLNNVPVTLTHQEHAPLIVPPGNWQIRKQRQASIMDEPIPVRD